MFQNRPEMLEIEPLHSLLRDKWERFASKLFLMNLGLYLIYLTIFTTVAFYRRDGQVRQRSGCINNRNTIHLYQTPNLFYPQAPFSIESPPADHLRCAGEIISVLGAVWFLYKTVRHSANKSHINKFNLIMLICLSFVSLD